MVVQGLHGSLLRFQLEISGSLALHALDHWQCQFLSWCVGALATIQDGQVVSQGSCKREPPAFEHSDWLGMPVWPVVARVQGCYRAVVLRG